MSHHFHCFYPNPNQLHFSPRRFPRASLLVSPLLLLPCYLVFKTAFRTVLFIVTFCLNCLKGFPLNSEFKPKIFQRSTKTHSSSTPASCHSCYVRVSLPVPHTYQACLYPRDFAQAVPAAWNALLPYVTPSPPLRDSLAPLRPPVLCANVISVRSTLTILFKMANLIPEFRIILIPIFFPTALIAIDVLQNFLIFSFITSLSLAISTFWKFSACSFGLSCHVWQ